MMPDHPIAWTDIYRARNRVIERVRVSLFRIRAAMEKCPALPINSYSLVLWDNIHREIASCSAELLSVQKLSLARLRDMDNSGCPFSPEDNFQAESARMECQELMVGLQHYCLELSKEIKKQEISSGKIPHRSLPHSPVPSQVDICA